MLRLLLIMSLVLAPGGAKAATYYLNPAKGNDSAPGTQARPWKTLNKVASSTGPGDVVNIQAGTYTPAQYTTDGSWRIWTARHRHGQAGKPITLQATPGAAWCLTASGNRAGWTLPRQG